MFLTSKDKEEKMIRDAPVNTVDIFTQFFFIQSLLIKKNPPFYSVNIFLNIQRLTYRL